MKIIFIEVPFRWTAKDKILKQDHPAGWVEGTFISQDTTEK